MIRLHPVYSSFLATCPQGWSLFEGNKHCYQKGATGASFTDAEAYCVTKGGHLASIHSKEENKFIHGKIYEE